MNRLNQKRTKVIIFYGIIFLSFYYFFTKCEPIMVCDPDDWTYISYIRLPFPLWGNWNPTKIFPETFMGIIGTFAARVFYPVVGDYLSTMTYTYAAVICTFILIYIVSADNLMARLIPNYEEHRFYSIIFFIALHFLFFKSQESKNIYMFTASNLNCFMNYCVPLWLNCFLAFKLISNDGIDVFINKKSTGAYILLIYLAIFSNMVVNIVFVAPGVYFFFRDLISFIKSKKVDIKRIAFYVYVILLEAICLVFEMNGGRADSLEFVLKEGIIEFINNTVINLKKINLFVLLGCIFISVLFIIIQKKKQGLSKDKLGVIILSFIICLMYISLLYIRIGQNKILRSENIAVVFVYLALFITIEFSYLLCNINSPVNFEKLISFLLIVCIVYGGRHIYKSSFSYYRSRQDVCYAVNSNIINQYVNAELNGDYNFKLILPESGLGEYSFTASRISKTLYYHGITNVWMQPEQIQTSDFSYFYEGVY